MKLKRGDKIYLDKENTKPSIVNFFSKCRDGVIEMYEYRDCGGYGNEVRLFLCNNTKHEAISIVRQTLVKDEWQEEELLFDSDSFKFLGALLAGRKEELGGKYFLVRDYENERL